MAAFHHVELTIAVSGHIAVPILLTKESEY
ncbi:hypothetical protein Hhis01_01565 [Haloarcula hispanica]